MTEVPTPHRLRVKRLLAAAWLAALVGCVSAQAASLPGGVKLGMSAQELQQAVPSLAAVKRPARLAGGLTGRWSAPAAPVAGIELAPTFYFAEEQLRRIEYLSAPAVNRDAFNALLAWGRAAWGPEKASEGPEGSYAAWVDEEADADVYLQRSSGSDAAPVRLVIKRRAMKDAGEL